MGQMAINHETEQGNKALWESVCETLPSATTNQKLDGRSVTSICTVYALKAATEAFGPAGKGWGYEIVQERFDQGRPIFAADGAVVSHEMIHTVLLKVWYMLDGEKYDTPAQFGHTIYLRQLNNGSIRTDNEFGKKTVTDALKKCLTLLGFFADVHAGKFDDVKYVQAAKQAERDAKKEKEAKQAEQETIEPERIAKLPPCPQEKIDENLDQYRVMISEGRASADYIISKIITRAQLSDAQKQQIYDLEPIQGELAA